MFSTDGLDLDLKRLKLDQLKKVKELIDKNKKK